MPAIFYFCYLVGTWIVGVPTKQFAFEASWQWLVESVSTIGPAFILGCGVLATIFSILGYLTINTLWRFSVAKEWKKRQSSQRLGLTPKSVFGESIYKKKSDLTSDFFYVNTITGLRLP